MEQLLHNLAWTIGLEFAIYWAFLRKEPFWQVGLFIVFLNLFTLPLAMLAFQQFDLPLWPLEIGIGLTEGVILKFFWKKRWLPALGIGLLANIFSQGAYLILVP